MQCTEFETALQDAADRRQLVPCGGDGPDGPPDGAAEIWRELRRHAEACPRCRSLWRQFHFVDDALRGWGRQTFDGHLTDAVMARWHEEREAARAVAAAALAEPPPVERPDRSGHRLRAAVYAAVIAALLAVLIGPPRWFAPTESAHGPDRATNPPVTSEQPTPADPSPRLAKDAAPDDVPHDLRDVDDVEPVPWGSLVESAGTAYRMVADDTAKTWSGVKQLVSAWTPPEGVSTEPKPEGGSESGAAEPWLDDLRRDLQPVGRDMTRPLEFLREALPIPSATL